jgi:hypothetical protein
MGHGSASEPQVFMLRVKRLQCIRTHRKLLEAFIFLPSVSGQKKQFSLYVH